MTPVNVFYLGTVSYDLALDIQELVLEKKINNEIDDSLILLEHPPTFTIGRRGNTENLLVNEEFLKRNNIELVRISRGGDITFHGPGQLVGYPIFDLNNYKKDIHKFLRDLEETIIFGLDNFGIRGRRIDKLTGVWVKRSKIASIGVGIKRWTSYHGFALNVNTDLTLFDMINPCGLKQVHMTSVRDWLGESSEIDMDKVTESILEGFRSIFKIRISKVHDLRSIGNEKLISEIKSRLEEVHNIR